MRQLIVPAGPVSGNGDWVWHVAAADVIMLAMGRLDRALLWKLAAFGPIMGVLIVAGAFPAGVEKFAWLAVDVFCAVAIGRAAVGNPFWQGAVTGFVVGASATLVQGLFIDSYLANNPTVAARFADRPPDFNVQYFVLELVPFIGIAGALVLGFLSFVSDRFLGRKETPA